MNGSQDMLASYIIILLLMKLTSCTQEWLKKFLESLIEITIDKRIRLWLLMESLTSLIFSLDLMNHHKLPRDWPLFLNRRLLNTCNPSLHFVKELERDKSGREKEQKSSKKLEKRKKLMRKSDKKKKTKRPETRREKSKKRNLPRKRSLMTLHSKEIKSLWIQKLVNMKLEHKQRKERMPKERMVMLKIRMI